MHFVMILGPYDSTFVGPFKTYAEALNYSHGVPNNFDAYVYNQADLDANFKEFGESPIESPIEMKLGHSSYAFHRE